MGALKDFLCEAIDASIETLLWSETDDDGNPLNGFEPDAIVASELAELEFDVAEFVISNWDIVKEYRPDMIGHDFTLTRNGHGAGFWDGSYSEPDASILTDDAKAYGAVHLMLNEEGNWLYVTG